MNIRHPGQLKKFKSWGPFWSFRASTKAQRKILSTSKVFTLHGICANPITVICPITPTVTDPITKMEVAHTVGLGKQDTTGQDEACYPSFGQKKVKKKFSSPFQQWDI